MVGSGGMAERGRVILPTCPGHVGRRVCWYVVVCVVMGGRGRTMQHCGHAMQEVRQCAAVCASVR